MPHAESRIIALQQQLSVYPKRLVDEEGFPLANVDVRLPPKSLHCSFSPIFFDRCTWFEIYDTSSQSFKRIISRLRVAPPYSLTIASLHTPSHYLRPAYAGTRSVRSLQIGAETPSSFA